MNVVQLASLIVAIVLFVIFLLMGVFCTQGRRIYGILIDSRNKVSLSRFQIVLWSWVIISAFLAVGLWARSMDFEIPTEIWALLGISLGSTAGAVIVKGTKQPQQPDTNKLGAAARAAKPTSVMHQNAQEKDAKLRDMFKGEEVTDFTYVDISKVQMFFFTLAAVLGYVWALSGWMDDLPGLVHAAGQAAKAVEGYTGADPGALETLQQKAEAARQAAFVFPKLSAQLVTILGISHAGYLTVKAAPKTPTA